MRYSYHVALLRLFLAVILIVSIDTSGCLTEEEVQLRKDLKAQIFGGLTYQRAGEIAAGQALPIFTYEWRDVLLVHWKITDVRRMQAYLSLPNGLMLAPTRLYEEAESDQYYLTLVARTVQSGSVTDHGFYQVDWVVYVASPEDGEPVLLTIESVATQDLFAATGLKQASRIGVFVNQSSYELKVSDPSLKFKVNIRFSKRPVKRSLHPEFIRAFDSLYWRNGVYSKIFSTSSLFKATLLEHHAFRQTAVESTPWSRFLSTSPVSVATFQEEVSLGEKVWVNAASVIDPAQQAYLSATITQAFAGKTMIEALDIFSGLREPTAGFTVENADVPAYFVNFHVPNNKLADLATAIDLPSGFTLSPVRTLENGPKDYVISLNVYSASGVAPGYRAEWSTYVNAPGSDVPSFIVIDVATSTPSLDPVRLLTPAAEVFTLEFDQGSGILTTVIQSGPNLFSAALPANLDCPRKRRRGRKEEDATYCQAISDEFLAANDLIYWSNGIADRAFYDGNQFRDLVKVLKLDEVTINDGTVWSSFWDYVTEVFLFRNEQDFVLSPWYNLEEVALCA